MRTVKTTWKIWTYDVWGNAKEGYDANDRYLHGETAIYCPVVVNNAGTEMEFLSASPTDKQIRKAFALRPFQITTDGDDVCIYVNRERDYYPIGEMICTSHNALSSILKKMEG